MPLLAESSLTPSHVLEILLNTETYVYSFHTDTFFVGPIHLAYEKKEPC